MTYSDRFRFRAWNKEKKIMRYEAEKGADGLTFSFISKSKEFVCEQCTGMKDKNGRLIYEGDIVEHDTAAGPKRWPVVFRDGCFVLPYESGNAWLGKVIQNCPYSSGVVVVGNIHENPDLLEAENEK